MEFLLTAMDGFELHLYINGEYCSFLDFDKKEDADYTVRCLKRFTGL